LKSLRVVLDTNCVVSALLFDGRLAWLRAAWQNGKITPLLSQATTRELLRVLAYPKFQLSANEREDVLAEFLPFAETVAQPAATPRIPQIRDPHDQAFLELAISGGADALVTGDSDLLVIASQISLPILSPAELRERVAGP
jgi:uncharacterized protein